MTYCGVRLTSIYQRMDRAPTQAEAGPREEAPPPSGLGSGLRNLLLLGLAGSGALLGASSALGWSPWLSIAPVAICAWFAVGRARSAAFALAGQVQMVESARREAIADSTRKAQFLANMSHEIRTPMNGILGMAELLNQTTLDSEQEQMASTIQSSADALLAVLNDILDYSKIEAGKLDLETVEFDVWQLVDECAGLMHKAADEKGVELLVYVDPRVARCHRGDSARIRQLLMNFLSNAVKFTLEGEVVVGVDLVDDGKTGIEKLRFWVRDTGVGISREQIERLFVPFHQADASTTRKFGGTGLGLVICHRLVKLMNGSIDVESRPGQGSTFSFSVTLAKGNSNNARKRAEEVDLSGHSVLVVDDNETNRKLMVMQLAPTKVGIDVAGNAINAVEMLRRAARYGKPFSMAILDMTMPGIDGMQLAEAIRNDPKIPQLPVSLTSSMGTRPGLAELAEGEVFRWLSKPLSSSRLLQVVNEMASLRRPGGDKTAAAIEAATPVEQEASDQWSVLVAEDNEINRRVIVGMLKRIGCQATFAADGREALRLVQGRDFSLVLMDCQMPVMDGFEASRAIRELGGDYARLPIVALTANVLPADREACLEAGMNDFLPKPVKLDLLRSAVLRWAGDATVTAD